MANLKISEMSVAATINESDNIELSQDGLVSGEYVTAKANILAIANKIASNINYTSALQTTSKTLTGAINEVAQSSGGGVFVSGTLTAGSTTITLSSVSITGNSRLAPYTSVYGVNPLTMVGTTGSVTMTFEAQQSDLIVGVEVK